MCFKALFGLKINIEKSLVFLGGEVRAIEQLIEELGHKLTLSHPPI